MLLLALLRHGPSDFGKLSGRSDFGELSGRSDLGESSDPSYLTGRQRFPAQATSQDWVDALALARINGVVALLHETARQGSQAARESPQAARELPEPARLFLRRARVGGIAEAQRWQRALGRVATALGGLRFAVIKGGDFAFSLYAAPELRPHADLDLLVAAKDFQTACARLSAAGYAHHPAVRSGPESRPGWHERTLLDPADPLSEIDLHQRFAQPGRSRLDTAALLSRSLPADDLAPGARRLTPEDAALAFSASFATHELRVPLLTLCDLSRLLPRCDATLLAQRAREARLAHPLWAALELLLRIAPAGNLAGARFSPQAARALAESLGLGVLARRGLSLAAAAWNLERRPQRRLGKLARKALLIDHPLDAARFAAACLRASLVAAHPAPK